MNLVHGWHFPASDRFMANELHADGTYQFGHLTAALAYVTDWSMACDAGAHVGTWSRVLSQHFTRVIAVEPSPDTYEALVANLATFGCTNVEPRPIALGAKPGRAQMVLEGRGAELKNTGARFVRFGGDIPIETIDSWELPSLGLLKMDIEGSEPAALRGALKTLVRCKPIVIYEEKGLARRYGEAKFAAAAVLRSVGYQFLEQVKMDHIYGWRR